MSNLVCKDCKSTDVTEYTPGIFGDSRHKCNSCGNISFTVDFIEPTVFQQITTSPEVLAETIVYEECEHSILNEEGCGAIFPGGWTSSIIEYSYSTKSEAIAATVARLKEVANG